MEANPVGLDGMEFIEFAGPTAEALQNLFSHLGFTHIANHKTRSMKLYRQNDVNIVLNFEKDSFAMAFSNSHGPCASSTGFRCEDKNKAFNVAVERGAKPFEGDRSQLSFDLPAIYGIGDSLVYFVDQYSNSNIYDGEFDYIADKEQKGFGLDLIDHLTNNVPFGEMQKWCDFYENVFNFKERRFFDIKGAKTGLLSKVMRSPCNKITIPINEPDGDQTKGQIQEYLDEYKGSGIQHIALITDDILHSVKLLREQGIKFLETPDTYYEMINDRVPNVTEDLNTLKNLRVLVDGDQEGYLLQIFTQNVCGPIFFEIIQRKNHNGFGEGNFQALFEAIERDQEKRGVI